MTEYDPEFGRCCLARDRQAIEAGRRSAHILHATTHSASLPQRPANQHH